jgi:hypothetical protein
MLPVQFSANAIECSIAIGSLQLCAITQMSQQIEKEEDETASLCYGQPTAESRCMTFTDFQPMKDNVSVTRDYDHSDGAPDSEVV